MARIARREILEKLRAKIARGFRSVANRRLIRLPHHINDPAFADAAVAAFNEIAQRPATGRAQRL